MDAKAILGAALNEAGTERYQAAAVGKMQRLKACGLSYDPRKMQQELPFLAACDTRFGDKQTYKLISRHCIQFHQQFFDRERGQYRVPGCDEAEGLVLRTLADTIEKMDIQLYEHYRALADMFLEAIRGLLSHGTEPNALTVYALLKGVRLGLLDEEKYLPVALKMKEALKDRGTEAPDLLMSIETECGEAGMR